MTREAGKPVQAAENGGAAAAAVGSRHDPLYLRGVVLVLLAGAFWSLGGILVRLTAVLATAMAGDLVVPPSDLSICLAMGALQIGAGLTLFTIGSRHVPAAELALLSLTEVILAPIWVWVGVGEVPSATTLLGGFAVLAAIAGQALTGLRRKPPPLGAV